MSSPGTMQAWQFDGYGHYTDVLHWTTRALPVPGPGHARVRTAAVHSRP